MRANPFSGHWKGWALKIETFKGPEMATSEANASWGQKKLRLSVPTPSNGLSIRFVPIKIIKCKCNIKKQEHFVICEHVVQCEVPNSSY